MMLNDFDEDIMQQLMGKNNSDNVGIPLDRNSIDKKTNNYGHRLITLCKSLMSTLLMVGLVSIGTEVQLHAKM